MTDTELAPQWAEIAGQERKRRQKNNFELNNSDMVLSSVIAQPIGIKEV